MDSNFVASEIVRKLRQNHTARIQDLWDIIHTKYKHELSYYKVWDAKQKAIAKIFGDWEESYQRLRKLLLGYLDQDSGTQYNYHTIPRPYENSALSHYVYWAFAPCIAAFQYCRPMISIDGTHFNFNRRFDDPVLKALSLKAGYATYEAKFESIMQIIKEAKINLLRGVDPTDRHVAR
ncbi:uncharacterized protein LOC142635399 [Castanea sativa]|uniref:uncharacterized protein LOC142635399 n=1 Tax=Castanea sativa TaxID=21020 RepID=UPI003F654785